MSRWPIAAVLAAYLVLATTLSVLNPLFESPDEVHHAAYIKYLIERRSLPVLRSGELSEYHQAPLYYTLGALAVASIPLDDYDALAARANPFRSYRYWEPGVDNKNVYLHGPWDAPPYGGTALAVHVVRLLSVCMGLGTVYATYRLARRAFDWDALAAAGAAAVVAFNPVFLLISSSIHNDALTMCLGALLLWRCIALVRDGPSPRRALWAGVLLGLDWLTKISTIFISPALAVALVLAALRARQPWRLFLRDSLLAFGAAFALGGWTFVRNTLIYGEPTGVRQDLAVWTHWSAADALRAIGPELPFMWTTFWGRFGHGEVALPDWIFTALAVACAPAVLGLAVMFVRRALPLRHAATRAQALAALAPPLVLLTAALGALTGMFGYYLNSPDGHAARYTFPGLAAIACLLFAGWAELSGARARWVAAAAGTALCALSVYGVFVVVPAAYARPALVTCAPGGPATRFGDVAEVVAAEIEPEGPVLRPGGSLHVQLTWRALQRTATDYAVYVHVIDDSGVILAQRDTYPGLGRYPTTAWNPGDMWVDTIRVPLPQSAYTPNTLRVNFGLYEYASGARLAVTRLPAAGCAGAPAAPAEGVQTYALEAAPDANLPNAADVNFDGRFALRGYALEPRSVRPGETITLTLYWTALAAQVEHYTVFAHVVGAGDAVYANGDGVPVGGLAPTPLWKPGEIIGDTHFLRLAPDTPPGQYDVELGWYHSDTLERLFILEPNGVRAHNRWLLSPIRVQP